MFNFEQEIDTLTHLVKIKTILFFFQLHNFIFKTKYAHQLFLIEEMILGEWNWIQ